MSDGGEAYGFDAVDLFSGARGWDVAARALGLDTLGFEVDPAAILTSTAAGFGTEVTRCEATKKHPYEWRGLSVTEVNPADYKTRGQIASPPCQGFSTAGKGRGRVDSLLIVERLAHVWTATDLDREIAYLHDHMTDDRSLLALEPLRWLLRCAPSWVAWEQVPAVLPLWEACAVILRRRGWSVQTSVLRAEMYGVPQTRRRAVLVARAPWMVRELGPVTLPTPTHSRYYERDPKRLDDGVLPWVSMAQALGWGADARPGMTVTGGGTAAGGAEPFGRGAREGLVREREAGRWAQRSNYLTGSSDGRTAEERGRTTRELDQPSTTVTGKGFQWEDRVNDQSGSGYDLDEQAAQLVPFRGANANRFNGSTKSRNDGVRVTVQEAAALQTFPADHPWRGTMSQQYQQVGNAVPPLLALAILSAVLGVPFDPSRCPR